MRSLLLAIFLALTLPLPALADGDRKAKEFQAEPAPEAPAKPGPSKIAAPGSGRPSKKQLSGFVDPDVAKERPVPWMLFGFMALSAFIAAPFLYVAYRRSVKEAEIATARYEGREIEGEESAPAPEAVPTTPTEKALRIAQRAGTWVTVGRVSTQGRLDPGEAKNALRVLVEQGLLEEGTDESGLVRYRVPEV